MSLTVVVLTRDEQRHIARAIGSVKAVADRIFVIDSGSDDCTVDIARSHGAEVLTNPFITQAQQFNWALSQLPQETEWVFRLDADEVVSPELAQALAETLPLLGSEVAGVEVSRRMAFLGRPIRRGGLFPMRVIRVMRYGRGWSEDRWMDEHILVNGAVAQLEGELLDDNLNSLTWWTIKHNAYASREVVEMLNLEYRFLHRNESSGSGSRQAGAKRWLKERIYARLPAGLRALAYFLYRYLLRLGFLDGREGAIFHVLQGFWYRYLVDAKLAEVKLYMQNQKADVKDAIRQILGIKV